MGFHELTGLVRLPLVVLDGAERLGLDREELMRVAGLTAGELTDPDERVPVVKIWQLWKAVIRRSDDPALGLKLAEGFTTRGLGLIGYGVLHSLTLRDALGRLARYAHIVNEAIQITVEERETDVWITTRASPRFDKLRHPLDARLATLIAMAREVTGNEITPLEVRFPYERPEDTREHKRVFKCPLVFGADREALVLRRENLDLPVTTADETLTGYLDQLADEVKLSLSRGSNWISEVRRTIWEELCGGQVSVQRVASALAMSPRTLQRRLRDEHVSFSAVLDELRRAMAKRLLRDKELAIYEVAFLLGYAEPSTFNRAFRRWNDVAPQEYRRSLLAGNA